MILDDVQHMHELYVLKGFYGSEIQMSAEDDDALLPAAFKVYDVDPPSSVRRYTFPNSAKCFKCARFQALLKLYQVITNMPHFVPLFTLI